MNSSEQFSWFILFRVRCKRDVHNSSFSAQSECSLACLKGVMWLAESEFLKGFWFTFSKESFGAQRLHAEESERPLCQEPHRGLTQIELGFPPEK